MNVIDSILPNFSNFQFIREAKWKKIPNNQECMTFTKSNHISFIIIFMFLSNILS